MSIFSYLKDTGHIYIYAKPINMRFGEVKLKQLCKNEMGIDPENGDVFLFFNKAKNKLKLFYLDNSGSQELMKFMPKGGFMLPVADKGRAYTKMPIEKLSRLFREPDLTVEIFLDKIVDTLNDLHDGSTIE